MNAGVGVPLDIRKWVFWWPIIWGLTGWFVIIVKSPGLLGSSYLPGTFFLIGYILLSGISGRRLKMTAVRTDSETSPSRILPAILERVGFGCVLIGFLWSIFFLDRLGFYDVILISSASIVFGIVHFTHSYSILRSVPELKSQLTRSAVIFSVLAVVFNLAILYAFRGYFA